MLRRLSLIESLGVLPLRNKRSVTLSAIFRYKVLDLKVLSDEVRDQSALTAPRI